MFTVVPLRDVMTQQTNDFPTASTFKTKTN